MTPSDDEFYSRRPSARYINLLGVEDAKGKPQAVFIEKCNEDDPKAVSRKNKNGKVVFEKRYENMVVKKLTRVHIKKGGEYGTELHLHTSTGCIIQVPFNSNHTKKFVAVCHNIDLNKPIYLEPYKFPKLDKNEKPVVDKHGEPKYTSGWVIKQGGTSKEDKLSDALDTGKEGPVPQFIKLKNGKYDTSDHDEYLENYLTKWIEKNNLDEEAVSEKDDEDDDEEEESGDDDEPDTDDDDDDDEEEEEEEKPKPKKKVKKSNLPF